MPTNFEQLPKVYGDRWENYVSASVEEFNASVIEAEALWGDEVARRANTLRYCVATLHTSFEAVIRNEYSGNEDFQDTKFANEMKENITIIGSKENKLSDAINNAVAEIENIVKPHLNQR